MRHALDEKKSEEYAQYHLVRSDVRGLSRRDAKLLWISESEFTDKGTFGLHMP